MHPRIRVYTRVRECSLVSHGVSHRSWSHFLEVKRVLEKQIERRLVDGIRAAGGVAYKFASPGNDGVPDRIVILPDARPVFVELKTETGRLSARQIVQIRRLHELGQSVIVLYGADEVDDFVKRCQNAAAARRGTVSLAEMLMDEDEGL